MVVERVRILSQLHLYLYSLPRPDEMKLVDSGPYGLVRHPVYTALMLAFWITPTMVSISSSLCRGLTRFLQLEVLAR